MLMIRNHSLAGEPVAYRATPHASFDSVAPALAPGALLRRVELGDRWSKVDSEGGSDVEGWVNNRFIVRLKDAPRSLVGRSRGVASKAVKKTAKKRPPATRSSPKGRGSKPQ